MTTATPKLSQEHRDLLAVKALAIRLLKWDKQYPHYTVPNPTHCDDEYLPTGWQDFAEQKGIPEPEIWPIWRRFKDITRWPFELRRWRLYIEKVVNNRKERAS